MGCSIEPKEGQLIFCCLQEVIFAFKLETNILFFALALILESKHFGDTAAL